MSSLKLTLLLSAVAIISTGVNAQSIVCNPAHQYPDATCIEGTTLVYSTSASASASAYTNVTGMTTTATITSCPGGCATYPTGNSNGTATNGTAAVVSSKLPVFTGAAGAGAPGGAVGAMAVAGFGGLVGFGALF